MKHRTTVWIGIVFISIVLLLFGVTHVYTQLSNKNLQRLRSFYQAAFTPANDSLIEFTPQVVIDIKTFQKESSLSNIKSLSCQALLQLVIQDAYVNFYRPQFILVHQHRIIVEIPFRYKSPLPLIFEFEQDGERLLLCRVENLKYYFIHAAYLNYRFPNLNIGIH